MQAPPAQAVFELEPRLAGQVGLVLLVATLAIVPLVVALARAIFPGRNVYFARWGFSHVVLAALAYLAAAQLAHWVLPRPEPPTLTRDLLIGVAAGTVAALCVAAWARKLSPEGLRALGLARGRHLRAVAAGIASYLALLPGLVAAMLCWIALLSALGVEPVGQDVVRRFVELPRAELPLAVAGAVLVIPLLEELLFRAFLQPLLVQNLNDKAGIAVTSLIFASLHGEQALGPVFVLSLILGSVMLRTQSLVAVWAIHALHNGLTVGLLLSVRAAQDAGGAPGVGGWLGL